MQEDVRPKSKDYLAACTSTVTQAAKKVLGGNGHINLMLWANRASTRSINAQRVHGDVGSTPGKFSSLFPAFRIRFVNDVRKKEGPMKESV